MAGKKLQKTKNRTKKQKQKCVNIDGWEVSDISYSEDGNDCKEKAEVNSHIVASDSNSQMSDINNPDDKSSDVVIESIENQSTPDDIPGSAEINDTVSSTNTKKKKKKDKMVQRSEASQNISEFNLAEVGKERVKLNELIKTSQKLSGQVKVKKQLLSAKKLKSLSVPLSKPQMQKIKRGIAYEKVCEEIKKWDSVVRSNRAADQIIYPLKKPDISLDTFENVSQQFVTKHPVEVAVSELLNKSENKLEKAKPLTAAEEKALQAMSLEEAKLRHSELMKHRALISYQEAKARRQNKIKSKRYHRLLKKEKLKKIMKEFEELEKVDAKAALEKIMEADKLRVLERMTLKHRNTGKWAKIQKLRAKYNPEARSVLKEDLSMGCQLREKLPAVEQKINKLKSTIEIQQANEMNQDVSLYDNGLIEEAAEIASDDLDGLVPASESVENELENQKNPEDTSLLLDKYFPIKQPGEKKIKEKQSKVEDTEFVNMEFISKATTLDSYKPNSISVGDNMDEESGDDSGDDENITEGIKSVSEAFADEDLIAEFREEKKSVENANRPKGIDLYLPGWGSWGGPGIKDSKSKRQRFFIPAELPPPKKDTLGSVIINEDKDKKASVHQVSNLPFPFSNVTQFESFIRQPLGHTWNPQSSFQNLNAPKVITKMGKVIEPIDPDDVMVQNQSQKGNQKQSQKRNQKQNHKSKKKKVSVKQQAF